MELTLTGKRVLVTGASSGLGEHFSEVLAKAGAAVTLSARRSEMVRKKAEALCRKDIKNNMVLFVFEARTFIFAVLYK